MSLGAHDAGFDPGDIPAWFRRPAEPVGDAAPLPRLSPIPGGRIAIDADLLQRSDIPIQRPAEAGPGALLLGDAAPGGSIDEVDDGLTIRDLGLSPPRPGGHTQHEIHLDPIAEGSLNVSISDDRTLQDMGPTHMPPPTPHQTEHEAIPAVEPAQITPLTPPPQGDPHTVAGRYQIRCRIGSGGMGVVYLAEDLRLHGRLWAIKVLSPWGQPEVERARFDREVRVISRLRNPHTVQVTDTGHLPDGRPFIVMEYIEGHPLGDLLGQLYTLTPLQGLEIAECILMSLHEAHEQGVIHRDLKPDNVMIRQVDDRRLLVQPGLQIKVLDFGIARDFNANLVEQRILDRRLSGTPAYMAPELFSGAPSDPRTDIYSVGVLLYHMLRGRLPFDPDDQLPPRAPALEGAMRMAWMHQELPPRPIPGCPAGVWRLLEALLAKHPDHRPQRAADALAMLERVKDGLGVAGDRALVPPPAAPSPPPAAHNTPAQPVEAQPPASSRSAAPMYWLIALMGLLIVGGIYYIADAFAG